MTSTDKHHIIAMFGASGNINSSVIENLEKIMATEGNKSSVISNYTLRIITRNPESLSHRKFSIKTEIVKGSICDEVQLGKLLEGVDRVFICLPQCLGADEMIQFSNEFTDAAKKAGVSNVVRISSFGMDNKNNNTDVPTLSQGLLGKAHIRGEEYMEKNNLVLTSIRPTSFFTNFINYDIPSLKSDSCFSSPLGTYSAVNWISCEDIAAVVAYALLDISYDGKVLNITGSKNNTLTAENMRLMIQNVRGRDIVYKESPVPDVKAMHDLWDFLRGGGFNHHTNTVEDITGRKPIEFESFLKTIDW